MTPWPAGKFVEWVRHGFSNPITAETHPEQFVRMYCVRERELKPVHVTNVRQVCMKNGCPALQANCPGCDTKMFKIGKLDNLEREIKEQLEHGRR